MTNAEIKDLSTSRKELNIKIDKADLEPIREKEIKKIRKQVQFPGFRKGKAPLNLIKRNYGELIELQTMESAADDAFRNFALENDLKVVGQPEAKKIEYNDDGDLVVVIEVDTYPEIELKKYTGFELTKDEYEITDKTVDDAIEQLRKEKAEITSSEGPVEQGDIVKLDMQELDKGDIPIIGRKYEDIEVRIGEGRFDPELEEQMIGLDNGHEGKIVKVYPDDFPQEGYAGKREAYQIKIKSIQKETLPELDDDFAKSIGEEIDSAEDLRKIAKDNLKAQYASEADNRFSADLNQKLLEENPFDLPDAIIDDYLNNIVADVKRSNKQASEEEIRSHYKHEAQFNIKLHLLREKIAEAENIEVTDEDINQFLEKFEDENLKDLYLKNEQIMNNLKHDLLNKKINTFIVENSKIKPNKITLD